MFCAVLPPVMTAVMTGLVSFLMALQFYLIGANRNIK